MSFTYPGCTEKALDDVSLRIEAGETVAIVGETGAGKSTLLKLVARFYEPDTGSIHFDGIDLRQVDRQALFEEISFVFQSFSRFEASVADNIADGDWQALLDQQVRVEDIAKTAGIDKMVQALPRGYDTQLGRRFGETDLSGGLHRLKGFDANITSAEDWDIALRSARELVAIDRPHASAREITVLKRIHKHGLHNQNRIDGTKQKCYAMILRKHLQGAAYEAAIRREMQSMAQKPPRQRGTSRSVPAFTAARQCAAGEPFGSWRTSSSRSPH